jgi:hypothetical protein
MPQLSLHCPHCHAEKIGFSPRGAVAFKPEVAATLLFLQCEGCGHGVIQVISSWYQFVAEWAQGTVASPGTVLGMYPEPAQPNCPAHVPDNVRNAFLSGVDNLNRSGNSNAAALMFRRTVEIAVKLLLGKPQTGDTLANLIGKLPDNLATPAMKSWAHHVRLDANDAAHEPEEFSDKDAQTLKTFAEMFLTYAYTLPEMLKKAGGEKELTETQKPTSNS